MPQRIAWPIFSAFRRNDCVEAVCTRTDLAEFIGVDGSREYNEERSVRARVHRRRDRPSRVAIDARSNRSVASSRRVPPRRALESAHGAPVR